MPESQNFNAIQCHYVGRLTNIPTQPLHPEGKSQSYWIWYKDYLRSQLSIWGFLQPLLYMGHINHHRLGKGIRHQTLQFPTHSQYYILSHSESECHKASAVLLLISIGPGNIMWSGAPEKADNQLHHQQAQLKEHNTDLLRIV